MIKLPFRFGSPSENKGAVDAQGKAHGIHDEDEIPDGYAPKSVLESFAEGARVRAKEFDDLAELTRQEIVAKKEQIARYQVQADQCRADESMYMAAVATLVEKEQKP